MFKLKARSKTNTTRTDRFSIQVRTSLRLDSLQLKSLKNFPLLNFLGCAPSRAGERLPNLQWCQYLKPQSGSHQPQPLAWDI